MHSWTHNWQVEGSLIDHVYLGKACSSVVLSLFCFSAEKEKFSMAWLLFSLRSKKVLNWLTFRTTAVLKREVQLDVTPFKARWLTESPANILFNGTQIDILIHAFLLTKEQQHHSNFQKETKIIQESGYTLFSSLHLLLLRWKNVLSQSRKHAQGLNYNLESLFDILEKRSMEWGLAMPPGW